MQPIREAPVSERLAYRSKTWMRSFAESDELSFGMYRSVQRAVQNETKWEKEFISWNSCPLPQPAISATLEHLRKKFIESLPSHAIDSLFGIWVGSPNTVIVAKDDFSVLIRAFDWGNILVPPLNRVFFHQTNQVGKKIFGSGPIDLIYGPSTEGHHPIRAFRQVAHSLLVEARKLAVNTLLKTHPQTIIDLYCGTGEISALIPDSVDWLGIEISRPAVNYANSLKPEKRRVHCAAIGLVEDRLRDRYFTQQVKGSVGVYINPPRPGLTRKAMNEVIQLLQQHKPESVVYLSCSASSLARDLRQLIRGETYRIRSLHPFDFFPQTEHFETLAILDRC